jgi:hypothetical protein
LDIERQALGIAASGIDTVAIFETTVAKGTEVAKSNPAPVQQKPNPVFSKFIVQVLAKLKE